MSNIGGNDGGPERNAAFPLFHWANEGPRLAPKPGAWGQRFPSPDDIRRWRANFRRQPSSSEAALIESHVFHSYMYGGDGVRFDSDVERPFAHSHCLIAPGDVETEAHLDTLHCTGSMILYQLDDTSALRSLRDIALSMQERPSVRTGWREFWPPMPSGVREGLVAAIREAAGMTDGARKGELSFVLGGEVFRAVVEQADDDAYYLFWGESRPAWPPSPMTPTESGDIPLPDSDNEQANFWVLCNDVLWRPAMEEIRRREGLTGDIVRTFSEGNTPTLSAEVGGENVILLTPPTLAHTLERERAMLLHAYDRLSVRTPKLVASGVLSEWPYLVRTSAKGAPLEDVWDTCDDLARRRLVRQIGQIAAEIRRLPKPKELPSPLPWREFVARKIDDCVACWRQFGAPAHWLKQMPGFLEEAYADTAETCAGVAHADLAGNSIRVENCCDGPRICGVVNFAEAAIAAPECQFAAPADRIIEGDRTLCEAFIAGYGAMDADGEMISRRVLAWAILHRRPFFLYFERQAPTLDGMARILWPV